MDPCSPQNPNPNSKNTYQISGIPVEFPYKPYGTQLAFMGRVIWTLDRAKRQNHCHALLESPTGTGKSLSLLCSALAWQRHHSKRSVLDCNGGGGPTAYVDPLVNGGGFIPDPDAATSLEGNNDQVEKSARKQRRMATPTIYYASRTHSQISQVVREFKKTSYRVPMAILASRKHYCTNKHVCLTENIDEECKLRLKDGSTGCPEFKNVHKVKGHSSLQKGGTYEIHDIEDLVKIGRSVKGCSYFASQTLAEEAQIVFCPYNYIISPIVRKAMDIDIKGSIVILDEAHNIEDTARDSGSFEVEEDALYTLEMELRQFCMDESVKVIYQPLHDIIQGIISWIGDRKNNLQKHDFERHSLFWTGDKAVNELQIAGITRQYFPILQECATKAIKAAQDADAEGAHLSGIPAITLERLFCSLGFFFSGSGSHATDYQLVLQRYVKRDNSNAASGLICSLSMWCLNPAVVFKDIANTALSVILTSGTLSPMGSFASELGVQFEACMEAPHVIDVEQQLWASVITSGPGNCQLNASYKTADDYAFQDSLGASLEEICKIVPGGALVFFPSYKLLEKLRTRWSQTGQWSKLNAQKPIFVEPRGSNDEFDSALGGYYDSIRNKGKAIRGTPKYGQKRISKHITSKNSVESSTGGATFLAVCRGKVSEGIDFADENARVVVIVGIPFPNVNDIQVVLKKKYNDTYKSSKNLLSGSDWYCHQAFRALNQAAGRCIRHKFDYGAVILLDERYKKPHNLTNISKWLRNSIKQYDSFDESMDGLRSFFEEKRFFKISNENGLDTYVRDNDDLSTSEKNLDIGNEQKKFQRQKKNFIRKDMCQDNADDSPLLPRISDYFLKSKEEIHEKSTSIDAELYLESKECNLKDINTRETIDAFKNEQSFSCCTTISNEVFSEYASEATITPERLVIQDTRDAEHESELNTSVNSYNQRKRKQTYGILRVKNKCVSPVPSDVTSEKKLHICCITCKKSLGALENDFLVACSSTSISKAYLSHVLNNGIGDRSSKCLTSNPKIKINVVICDISSVDQHIFDRLNEMSKDFWCEEDGCVFRTVFCPFCPIENICLGVEIKATDASNTHLLNKVVFFADCLYIKDEPMLSKETTLISCSNNIGEGSVPMEIEKFTYIPKLNDPLLLSRTKSKLRLPKNKKMSSSQPQDGLLR